MFLLDTNVLSGLVATQIAPSLVAWMAGTPERFLYTATICQAELLAGVAALPAGQRREALEVATRAMLEQNFSERIWPFDGAAAEAYAQIFAGRRRTGRHIDPPDLMIAAVALSRDASVVTRNVSDFDGCGVVVINPWDE
jgi:toxin FitB